MTSKSSSDVVLASLPKDVPLFRPEVGIGLAHQGMGSIRIRGSRMSVLATAAAVALAVSLVLFIVFGQVQSKAKVAGIVVPASGSITLAAQETGILKAVHVQEGARVRAGQLLFEISMARAGSGGELGALLARQIAVRREALESERLAKQFQRSQHLKGLAQRRAQLGIERAHLDDDIADAQRRLEIAEQSLHKFRALEASGYVSQLQIEAKQIDLLEQNSKLSTLKRNRGQLDSNAQQIGSEIAEYESEFASAQAQMSRSLASLEQEDLENQSRQRLFVRAPADGVITTIAAIPGQHVAASTVLSTLIPAASGARGSALEVSLYAPSRTAGFVAPGQKVLLRYQAFPYERFGLKSGTVVDISQTPLSLAELPPHLASTIVSNAQASTFGFKGSESLYRIRVKLAEQDVLAGGQRLPLKPGMTLDADIVQDQRRIWEWAVQPLLALR